jgi:hypothetical protein
MQEPLTLLAGVYEHHEELYLLIGLCRMHNSCSGPEASEAGDEFVAYVPLRVEPEWAGTARIALRPVAEFQEEFAYVGARLPNGSQS